MTNKNNDSGMSEDSVNNSDKDDEEMDVDERRKMRQIQMEEDEEERNGVNLYDDDLLEECATFNIVSN
jgi:hypothetical protein